MPQSREPRRGEVWSAVGFDGGTERYLVISVDSWNSNPRTEDACVVPVEFYDRSKPPSLFDLMVVDASGTQCVIRAGRPDAMGKAELMAMDEEVYVDPQLMVLVGNRLGRIITGSSSPAGVRPDRFPCARQMRFVNLDGPAGRRPALVISSEEHLAAHGYDILVVCPCTGRVPDPSQHFSVAWSNGTGGVKVASLLTISSRRLTNDAPPKNAATRAEWDLIVDRLQKFLCLG